MDKVLGLLVLIAVIFALAKLRGGLFTVDFEDEDQGQPVPLPDPRRAPSRDEGRVGFASIRHADPGFDLDTFYAHVTDMFLAYHAALETGDLKPMRRFVDERYYPELLATTADRPADSRPRRLKLKVLSARAMTARHEAGMDQVRVMISAMRGPEEPALHEYWTLIRRQGTITKADLSLYKCPNCGAPTDGDDPTRCAYCGARLADPSLDWVVSRIRTE